MTLTELQFKKIHRPGYSKNGGEKTERFSSDFQVNGQSLAELLGVSSDMMGRFVVGYPEANQKSRDIFLLHTPADLENGRTLLYTCGECADIGCGALTVFIRREPGMFIWENFAYENSNDPTMTDYKSYEAIGPYYFEEDSYKKIILAASKII